MRETPFRAYMATSQGGVSGGTPDSYVSSCRTVEDKLRNDLDNADLKKVVEQIDNFENVSESKKRDYKSAVRKYGQFRQANGG